MFFRLLFESFRRQKRRKSVALLAIALGMTIATAMIAVGNDVGDKINEDLRRNGGNLVLTPMEDTLDVNLGGVDLKPASEGAFIAESDLPKLKGIFWRRNIRNFVPYLSSPETIIAGGRSLNAELIGTYFDQPLHFGEDEFTAGVRSMSGLWKVQGEWPEDYTAWPEHESPRVLAGSMLAEENNLSVGDDIEIAGRKLHISGIVNTGGVEDRAIVAPLHIAQAILGQPNKVRRVVVSALTKPEDALPAAIPTRSPLRHATGGIARPTPTPSPSRFMKPCRTFALTRFVRSNRTRARS